MTTALVQCVPNFSEGRDLTVCAAIADAAQGFPGVRVADCSKDTDHNRMVLTLIGPPHQVMLACAAACAAAIDLIDLRTHAGAHPRLGAVDVVPFVPLSGVTLAECAALSMQFAREMVARHALPVFLYEAAADGRALPVVRKSAWKELEPDFGPHVPHPTAGAAVVGARGPLIAYNLNLTDGNLSAARQIARELRVAFAGVRALGLWLPSRNAAQVSLNITRPAETSLLAVFEYVQMRAVELGMGVSGQ